MLSNIKCLNRKCRNKTQLLVFLSQQPLFGTNVHPREQAHLALGDKKTSDYEEPFVKNMKPCVCGDPLGRTSDNRSCDMRTSQEHSLINALHLSCCPGICRYPRSSTCVFVTLTVREYVRTCGDAFLMIFIAISLSILLLATNCAVPSP